MYPGVVVYGIYALLTRPHKSWWSWFIHSLAHWVYTFQFIGMTPQVCSRATEREGGERDERRTEKER